jgi:hypothetical protein
MVPQPSGAWCAESTAGVCTSYRGRDGNYPGILDDRKDCSLPGSVAWAPVEEMDSWVANGRPNAVAGGRLGLAGCTEEHAQGRAHGLAQNVGQNKGCLR